MPHGLLASKSVSQMLRLLSISVPLSLPLPLSIDQNPHPTLPSKSFLLFLPLLLLPSHSSLPSHILSSYFAPLNPILSHPTPSHPITQSKNLATSIHNNTTDQSSLSACLHAAIVARSCPNGVFVSLFARLLIHLC
ncbi:hypothetical protein HDK64DRAFT_148710 [Phyllosticta capitalensis]